MHTSHCTVPGVFDETFSHNFDIIVLNKIEIHCTKEKKGKFDVSHKQSHQFLRLAGYFLILLSNLKPEQIAVFIN
jgi:hypothetical protein